MVAARRIPARRHGGNDVIRSLRARHPAAEASPVLKVVHRLRQPGRRGQRNVARMAALLAGLDPSVPAITLNRLCASGLDAVIHAAAKSAAALAN